MIKILDTVCFLIHNIPTLYLKKIENKLKTNLQYDNSTGEVIYQFSVGSIEGSYDSSINIKINKDNSLKITCSIHKVLLGYNIAYGSDNLVLLANCLKKIIKNATEVKLPDVLKWELLQVDYTLTFDLDNQYNVESYINSLKNAEYARRQAKHYNNNGLQVPGATTIVKFYNKQKEFIEHDYKKIKAVAGVNKADELLNLSEGLLRVEVSIRSRKLKDIFKNTVYKKEQYKKYKNLTKQYGLQDMITQQFIKNNLNKNIVTLKDFNIEDIKKIWESEVLKVVKDKKEILINKDNLVMDRLKENYSTKKVNALYTFWTLLSTRGEGYVKDMYNKATFYRNRKDLIDCGITWKDTNIFIETNHNIVVFTPTLNSTYLKDLNKPNIEFKERVYNLLKVV